MSNEVSIVKASQDALSRVARMAGIEQINEDDYVLPGVWVGLPSREFCIAVANSIPVNSLFRIDQEVMTFSMTEVTDVEGNKVKRLEQRPMSPTRLMTWLEQHIRFFKKTKDGGTATDSIGKNKAEMLLASDEFRNAIPLVREVSTVRLPRFVVREDGMRVIELTPPGYDPVTKVYTAEEVTYELNAPLSVAVRVMEDVLREFPWYEDQEFRANRSAMVAVAGMLGQFCRHMIDRHPMIICMGNQPGTGKTLLAQLMMAPAIGEANITPFPKNDDEALRKVLNSALLAGNGYILFDDIPSLMSPTINQFATARVISDRYLGSNAKFTVNNRMQMIATGNNLTTTPDVERRALFCDLFSSELATARPIKRPMTATSILEPAFRSDVLSCLWAFVRTWSEQGSTYTVNGLTMPSFESFAKVVGSIMEAAKFSSPFSKRLREDGADEQGKALTAVLAAIAATVEEKTKDFKVQDILDMANEMGKTDIICPGKAEPRKALGHRLRKIKGREFFDTKGRRFAFGKKEESVGSIYTIYVLDNSYPSRP